MIDSANILKHDQQHTDYVTQHHLQQDDDHHQQQQQQPERREIEANNRKVINTQQVPIVLPDVSEAGEAASPVHHMFQGQSIFITGASGFIGRVLLEKLLRTYAGIKRIYILMRTKKNQNPYDRLHKQLLNVPIFDAIRAMKNSQEILNKIIVIPGDIAEANLGICDEHLKMMLDDKSLSIVFHSAATIKFDEPLRTSIKLNLAATKTIIDMCKQLPNLIGLCHVSTAYVNSHIKDNTYIQEKLYPFKDDPEQLIKLANILDEDLLQVLKARLVDGRPNTYTYTKAAAEHLVASEACQLPVSIVRPSIVVAAWKEPIEGWVDNLNGATGLILAIGKGLLRTMYCDVRVKAEIVPVDIVVNSMIASVYYTAKINDKLPFGKQNSQLPVEPSSPICPLVQSNGLIKNANLANNNIHNFRDRNGQVIHSNNNNHGKKALLLKQAPVLSTSAGGQSTHNPLDTQEEEDKNLEKKDTELVVEDKLAKKRLSHPIIHCNSGQVNPLTWGDCENLFFPVVRKYPSCQVLRYPYGTFKANRYHDYVTRIFVHFLPAIMLDLIAGLLGKKKQLFSIYKKVHQATGALTHFCTQNYNFQTRNIKKLEQALEHPLDREQLFMDIDNVDWIQFWDKYILGARRFVLKEPDESLPEARKSFQRAHWVELGFRALLVAMLGFLAFTVLASYRPTSLPASQAIKNL